MLIRGEQVQISVLMGVYAQNGRVAALERAVDSILDQTEPNFELLICDDGSCPAAVDCLNRFAAKDGRIQLIRRGNAFTLPQKLNLCLAQARGAWIARMDDDDFSHEDRFERQLKFLREHKEFGFVGCNVALVQDGVAASERCFPEAPTVEDFYFSQPYIHPALLFRREVLLAVGGYSEEKCCILCEDYDLLLRLYAAGFRGANIQNVLFDYTLPSRARGTRRMKHRVNEVITRYRRLRDLKCLPQALPYVFKPIFVGLLPERMLLHMKKKYYEDKV